MSRETLPQKSGMKGVTSSHAAKVNNAQRTSQQNREMIKKFEELAQMQCLKYHLKNLKRGSVEDQEQILRKTFEKVSNEKKQRSELYTRILQFKGTERTPKGSSHQININKR